MTKSQLTPMQRIWRFLDFTSKPGCWLWTGGVNSWGYGAFHVGGKRMVAIHRWLYQQFHGPLGRWEFCLHQCDTPRCCNPAHLYVGTAKDNVNDMYSRGRDRSRGEQNTHAKLTEAQVIEIIGLYKKVGPRRSNIREIQDRYPAVTPSSIVHAAMGRTWKHLHTPSTRSAKDV